MPARPCLFVACAPSGSRIHPPYVKLFRKHCPAESTRIVERPKNQGPEQLHLTPVPATGDGLFLTIFSGLSRPGCDTRQAYQTRRYFATAADKAALALRRWRG